MNDFENAAPNKKICLITGANAGIGFETALALAKRGMHLLLVCREEAKGQQAAEKILASVPQAKIELYLADLSTQASIRDLAVKIRAQHNRLDILINNAGAVFPKRAISADGFEMTLAVNYLGPFLLTQLFLDALLASPQGRIINVSSMSHERATLQLNDLSFVMRKYTLKRAYGQSKLLLNLFTRELARLYKDTPLICISVHPGLVATNIGFRKNILISIGWWLKRLTAISPQNAARSITYLTEEEKLAALSGEYFADFKPAAQNSLVYDEALASQVWELSRKLVKI